MSRYIDADAIKYTMLYKENWLKGTGVEKQCVWKEDIDSMPTVDAVPVSELKDTEKERDYWMDMAHSYEQTILRLTISASDTTAEPARHGHWIIWDEIIAGIYHTVSECSECGFTTDKMQREEMRYCPNCGARMGAE